MANAKTQQRLVIVESPAKAKTISGYLGPGYVVEASYGHVRDLPRNAADVPAKYKGESWARLGVDVDNDFEALYVVSPDRTKQVTKLKSLLKDSTNSCSPRTRTARARRSPGTSWRPCRPQVPVRRMVFHEITKPAIQAAVANPREIDQSLVDAQEARRILDRLYGYEVSPVLWKKVMPKGPDGGPVGRPGPVGRHPDRGPARAGADALPYGRVLGRAGHPGHRSGRGRRNRPGRFRPR